MAVIITPQEVYAKWAPLFAECKTLATIKETQTNRYQQIRVELAAIISDVNNALKDLTLSTNDIAKLTDIKRRANEYLKI